MDAMQARAQTWQRRLADQLDSGLSIADWCRNNGCCRQSFYRWQARLGHGESVASAAGFTEIRLAPPTTQSMGSQPLRLRLIGGRELLVPMSMPPASLAQLLHALEAGPQETIQSEGAGFDRLTAGCPELARPELVERIEGACPEPVEGSRP